MIQIEVLLSEEQMAAEFVAALAARFLPEKFFYWLPLSVRAWLDLCRGTEYKNFARSQRLISAQAADIAARVHGPEVEVISLGSGQGDKDILILDALRHAGRRVCYRAVDASQALLELACARAVEGGFVAHGLKADLGNAEHLAPLRYNTGQPRLFLLLGNTFGAFDPLAWVTHLGELLGPRDYLLVDGEIYGGAETMAGYDNLVNRRFAFAPLRSIGIREEDGELIFGSAADERMDGLYLVSKHFRPGRTLDLLVAGESLRLEKQDKIAMNSSYKYSRATFLELIERRAGLHVMREYMGDDERFLMVLAAQAR